MKAKKTIVLVSLLLIPTILVRNIVTSASFKNPFNVYPWDMMKKEEFRDAYIKMLGKGTREAWISELDCTAGPIQKLDLGTPSQEYTFIECCKPHSCIDNTLRVLYSSELRVAYAKLAEFSESNVFKETYFGNPPQLIKEYLNGN